MIVTEDTQSLRKNLIYFSQNKNNKYRYFPFSWVITINKVLITILSLVITDVVRCSPYEQGRCMLVTVFGSLHA